LHYEFRVAGVHRNPLTITQVSAPPLAPTALSQFTRHAQELLAQIATIRGVQLTLLD
jgi:hypothetical protein